MDHRDVLIELFNRIPDHVRRAVAGLTPAQLVAPPGPGANTVGWLVWHLTRVQDHHVSALLDEPQLWVTGSWAPQFGLPPDPHNTGYGHSADDVVTVRPESDDVLIDYYGRVHERTLALLARITPDALDQVVDERWDPPVTLGVRLASVADDDIQHAGQAAYARGMVERSR